MTYKPLAATIAALALCGCAPPPAPAAAICPAAAPAPVAVAIAPAPTVPAPTVPAIHHHVVHATHPVAIGHHPVHRYYAARTTWAPGCGSTEHACNIEHETAPVQ